MLCRPGGLAYSQIEFFLTPFWTNSICCQGRQRQATDAALVTSFRVAKKEAPAVGRQGRLAIAA